MLRAFAELRQKNPAARLRIAGGGNFSNEVRTYPQQLKQFVAEAGLEAAVTFVGELDRAALLKAYARCSVLVLPSVVETAPMVIMEAMAAGKAVVCTDAGGARHLVAHGQTGLIVPPNDAPALAGALEQVLGDEARLEAMGNRARGVAEQRFHASVVAARTREVYYAVLGRRPPEGHGHNRPPGD